MGTINRKKPTETKSPAHKNFMGGNSWDIKNPILVLRIAASSCFFGEPKYYAEKVDGKLEKLVKNIKTVDLAYVKYLRDTLGATVPEGWESTSSSDLMVEAIDKALDYSIEETLEEAARLRNEDHIRTTPQVILVRAAMHEKSKGTGLIRKYAPQIIKRADEPAVQLAYFFSQFSDTKSIPNSLKKSWRDFLQKQSEDNLAKYRMDNREVKTVDVVNLAHPKSEAINKLVQGKCKNSDKTWEAIRSSGGSWKEAMEVMGHMALLRNIRNLIENKVKPDEFIEVLKEGAKTGKQLPFRYWSAYNAVKDSAPAKVLDAIEDSMIISLGNVPKFNGKVMSLCDNSGSAQGATTSVLGSVRVADIANLSAVITGMVADEGHVGVFGDRLETFEVRKRNSILDQVKKANDLGHGIGQSTENGIWLFFDKALRTKEHWDHVFIYSDMQAGHGGLYGLNPIQYNKFRWFNTNNIDVPKLISEYRKTVNPDVRVYLVQVAGYQDTLVPEFYKKTYILGGWGDGLLRFAKAMEQIDK